MQYTANNLEQGASQSSPTNIRPLRTVSLLPLYDIPQPRPNLVSPHMGISIPGSVLTQPSMFSFTRVLTVHLFAMSMVCFLMLPQPS